MVVICCISLCMDFSAAEIQPISTHPILVGNDLFAILNLDYCPALSNVSLMRTSNNNDIERDHEDLNNIKSTSCFELKSIILPFQQPLLSSFFPLLEYKSCSNH